MFKTIDEFVAYLFKTLDARSRPEDIAQAILSAEKLLPVKLPLPLRKRLEQMRPVETYMTSDFRRVDGASATVKVAGKIFPKNGIMIDTPDPDDYASLKGFAVAASGKIARPIGGSFVQRMNRANRKMAGLGGMSKRQYNKLYRFLGRMEKKAGRMERDGVRRDMTMAAKSRLAKKISRDDFVASPYAAMFVAYYTATCNRRSEFTVESQHRPYDKVADGLLNLCLDQDDGGWFAIAHVFTPSRVLEKLTEEEKGKLVGLYFGIVEQACLIIDQLWKENTINARSMIVQRGTDSSTWNAMAGAYNKAREAWFTLLKEMGMGGVIESCCPGKILRLMAADVASWHRSAGDGLDPDTSVWNELPYPWEVVLFGTPCPRSMVEEACKKYKVKSTDGWTAGRDVVKAGAFKPTPELVHGVTVTSPKLAKVLRDAGAFSGKKVDVGKIGNSYLSRKEKDGRIVVEVEE